MLENQCSTWSHQISVVLYIPLVMGRIFSAEEPVWNKRSLDVGVAESLSFFHQMEASNSSCILDLEVVVEERCERYAAMLYPTNALRNRAIVNAETGACMRRPWAGQQLQPWHIALASPRHPPLPARPCRRGAAGGRGLCGQSEPGRHCEPRGELRTAHGHATRTVRRAVLAAGAPARSRRRPGRRHVVSACSSPWPPALAPGTQLALALPWPAPAGMRWCCPRLRRRTTVRRGARWRSSACAAASRTSSTSSSESVAWRCCCAVLRCCCCGHPWTTTRCTPQALLSWRALPPPPACPPAPTAL